MSSYAAVGGVISFEEASLMLQRLIDTNAPSDEIVRAAEIFAVAQRAHVEEQVRVAHETATRVMGK